MHQQAAQATWNPERDLWETDSMDLFSGLSDVFSETLPISGMTRSGRLFLRPQSEPHTGGNESSSSPGLPTPRATRGGSATETIDLLPTPEAKLATSGPDYARAARDGSGGDDLTTAVHLLPTPCASPSGNSPEEHLRKKPGRERVTDLSILVENDLLSTGGKLLPTPRASDGEKDGPNQRGSKGDLTASSAVHLLPTPKAGDADFGLPRTSGRPPEKSTHLATRLHFTDFGQYADAIERWEKVLGRDAPAPTELTDKGKHRLSAAFVEWLMGLDDEWVTDPDLGLSRVSQLRALGNGVVPQQAVYAITWLLERADLNLTERTAA